MVKINIGQMIDLTEDMTIYGLSGDEAIFKKGTKLFVGAERKPLHFFHTLHGQMISITPNDGLEITDRYSVNGLAEWIYAHLSREFPIDEMLEDCCCDDDDNDTPAKQEDYFKRIIADALEELGMYDYTGNRS